MSKDFLVEIGTEELPPKALKTLAVAFSDGISSLLDENQLQYKSIEWFATPRRLAVRVSEVVEHAPNQNILPPPKIRTATGRKLLKASPVKMA